MKGLFKKTVAVTLTAATVLVAGMGGRGVEAAVNASTSESWEVSCVNMTGVPPSTSKSQTVTVLQGKDGTIAVCNFNSHTNKSATLGYTFINCVSHSMTQQKITNLGSVICKPDVGSPTDEIPVVYRIDATTPSTDDIFWSKGTISKR